MRVEGVGLRVGMFLLILKQPLNRILATPYYISY